MEGGRLRGLLNLSVSPPTPGRPTCLGKGDPAHCSPASNQNPPTHAPQRGPQRVSIKSAPPFPSFSFPGDRFQGHRTCPVSALTSCLT